jgi:hypothetical protein
MDYQEAHRTADTLGTSKAVWPCPREYCRFFDKFKEMLPAHIV